MDISQKERFDYYQEYFKVLLDRHKAYRNNLIIIFGHKINNIILIEIEELLQKTEIPHEVSPYIFKCNVLKREGLTELLEYIYDNIELMKKKIK